MPMTIEGSTSMEIFIRCHWRRRYYKQMYVCGAWGNDSFDYGSFNVLYKKDPSS